MNFLLKCVLFFQPTDLHEDDYRYFKSSAFISATLTLLTINLVLIVSSFFLEFDIQHAIIITPIPIIFMLFVYKHYGNLEFYGNFFIFTLTAISFIEIMQTKGLYSDVMVWINICPLLGILFSTRRWAFGWFFIVIFMTIGIFILEKIGYTHFYRDTVGYSYEYMAISFIGFFTALFAFVFLFEKGQRNTIVLLNKQKILLEEQKEALSKQSQELSDAKDILKKKNSDLENFAYAASHDLKEPLRMIAMYTQLLERRMKDTLSTENKEFMAFVTGGVFRMETLLNDLLLYSRMGRSDEALIPVNLNNTLLLVQNNLQVAIKESDTTLMIDDLPTVSATRTEMTQLFQNLIANSIKFKKKEIPPVIKLCYTKEDAFYHFSVEDNGIGIAPEYQEKVFNIFMHIHTQEHYAGSGIGLSTCKKIIENMNGRIWIQSTENVGTSVHFTIPV